MDGFAQYQYNKFYCAAWELAEKAPDIFNAHSSPLFLKVAY